MIKEVGFFTPISFKEINPFFWQKCLEKVDNYFYLGGHKAIFNFDKNLDCFLIMTNSPSVSFLEKSIKIVSYCTLIIPVTALIVKIALRVFFSSFVGDSLKVYSPSTNESSKMPNDQSKLLNIDNLKNQEDEPFEKSNECGHTVNPGSLDGQSSQKVVETENLKNLHSNAIDNNGIEKATTPLSPKNEQPSSPNPTQSEVKEWWNNPQPSMEGDLNLSDKIVSQLTSLIAHIAENSDTERTCIFYPPGCGHESFSIRSNREIIFKIPSEYNSACWGRIKGYYDLILEIRKTCEDFSLDLLQIPRCQLLYIPCNDGLMPVLAQENILEGKKTQVSFEAGEENESKAEKALIQLVKLISKVPLYFRNSDKVIEVMIDDLNCSEGNAKIALPHPECKASSTKVSIEGYEKGRVGLINCFDSEEIKMLIKNEGNKRGLL